MKTLPYLVIATAALGFVSCTTTGMNQTMVPRANVENVERMTPVTHNPNGLSEALNARTASRYGRGNLFGHGGLGVGF